MSQAVPEVEAVRPRPEGDARLAARVAQLRDAMMEWGIRNDTPEGAVFSGFLGALAELGAMTSDVQGRLEANLDRLERAAAAGGAETRVAAKSLAEAGESARRAIAESDAFLREARSGRSKLPEEVAALIGGQVAERIAGPLRSRIVTLDRKAVLRQRLLSGLVATAILGVGVALGAWAESGPTLLELSVEQCARSPTMAGDRGWCDLDRLMPGWRRIQTAGSDHG